MPAVVSVKPNDLKQLSPENQMAPEEIDLSLMALHYPTQASYLYARGISDYSDSPKSSRYKLEKITNIQFIDLSTDVFDEIRRREHMNLANTSPLSFPKQNYSEKRLQAREKLSMLSEEKFIEIIKDIIYEWSRRFPEHVSPAPSKNNTFAKRKSPSVNTFALMPSISESSQMEKYDEGSLTKSHGRFSLFTKMEKLFGYGKQQSTKSLRGSSAVFQPESPACNMASKKPPFDFGSIESLLSDISSKSCLKFPPSLEGSMLDSNYSLFSGEFEKKMHHQNQIISSQKETIISQQNEIEKTKKELEVITKECLELKSEKKELNQKISCLNEDILSLETTLTHGRAHITTLENKVSQLAENISDLSVILDKSSSDYDQQSIPDFECILGVSSIIGSIKKFHALNTIYELSEYFVYIINKSHSTGNVATVMKSYIVHIKEFLLKIEKLEKEYAVKNSSLIRRKEKNENESSHGGRLSLSLSPKILLIAAKELRDKCSTSLRIILKLVKASFGENNEPSVESIRPIEMIIHDIGIILWRLCQAKTIFLISLGRHNTVIDKIDSEQNVLDSFQTQGIISPISDNNFVESETEDAKKNNEKSLPLLMAGLDIEASSSSSTSFNTSTISSLTNSIQKNNKGTDRFENFKNEIEDKTDRIILVVQNLLEQIGGVKFKQVQGQFSSTCSIFRSTKVCNVLSQVVIYSNGLLEHSREAITFPIMLNSRKNAEAALCNFEVAIGTFSAIKQLIFQKRSEGNSEEDANVYSSIEDIARNQLVDACHCLIKSTRDFLRVIDNATKTSSNHH